MNKFLLLLACLLIGSVVVPLDARADNVSTFGCYTLTWASPTKTPLSDTGSFTTGSGGQVHVTMDFTFWTSTNSGTPWVTFWLYDHTTSTLYPLFTTTVGGIPVDHYKVFKPNDTYDHNSVGFSQVVQLSSNATHDLQILVSTDSGSTTFRTDSNDTCSMMILVES